MSGDPLKDMQEKLDETATHQDDFTVDVPAGQGETFGTGRNLESVMRIPVLMQVVLGSARMPVANLMKLGRGAIVPLDHRVGEPVEVVVNGRVIARGEVVVVEDDNSRFGVSLTEIVGPAGAELTN
ncbi:flagellar motor switch protein FliN [Afifella marina]|uniref:Flagellar motor switch protein FliN n=1 Tax=Afifella marina DSM 2698 TaxID=1120955 RepID=A0A1G5MV10_AFIMA|nr:flagellar motor switch protein FliN [Afifella marina]MBK1622030.1 flagellar motor switch protein FliN [Afifella marina DSM 2698]MBK1627823.1 flagellar motor switch protein FliN [Afifella marina]MBK5916790.1 flagellar motor switch protein FliN [Afifella marina]RAI19884.1 flagellar motor switch protein FliN [Afifella marina DSM 2698]SCZ28902.1 flagellar motor switch protein FliN/FliY [Afifella marina DSM 2698]